MDDNLMQKALSAIVADMGRVAKDAKGRKYMPKKPAPAEPAPVEAEQSEQPELSPEDLDALLSESPGVE